MLGLLDNYIYLLVLLAISDVIMIMI